ncbi:MAG: alpha amylase C-terminal domain-containing protein [Lachnospiraceae bacterium]|nr:alpha amylase C-terminal domain-containing protein [Lachnospiraceae bacterium]
MNKKLYKMMNWPEIESVIYSDGDRPDSLLGAHDTAAGILIQAFFPDVAQVTVVLEKQDGNDQEGAKARIKMELADDDGFYACLVPGKKADELRYHYEITANDGSVKTVQDSYRFPSYYREEDEKSFSLGVHYEIYERLGAHPMKYEGVEGTWFATLAPDAARVSVVGDFNGWNGRAHQMSRFEDTNIFGIFIPGVGAGASYQFEIKARSGHTVRRSDPFAFEVLEGTACESVVASPEAYTWRGKKPVIKKTTDEGHELPLSVYEFDPASFGTFRKAAEILPKYVTEMGFNAVTFRPSGEEANSPYAPDSRFGKPTDLCRLVDAFHKAGILVFFKWNPVSFAKVRDGLSYYDMKTLFEYEDPLKRDTADEKRSYFNLADKRISDYLIANAMFLAKVYRADGLVTDDIAQMLYLDYGKTDVQHAVNMYGGTENLEAVEFLHHFNSILHKTVPEFITIAKETARWPGVTGGPDDNHLGFDYKLHTAYRDALVEYMNTDPLFRQGRHELLLEDMVYQYTERFMLPFLSKDCGPAAASILSRMPGASEDEKKAELRLLLSTIMVHPGARILNLGETAADTEITGMRAMVSALNALYKQNPAFYENDSHPDGFEWIRQMANEQNVLCFLRKGSHPADFVLVLINYSGTGWKTRVGVPYAGKYKKIFSSSAAAFGGKDGGTDEPVTAESVEADGRSHSCEFEIGPNSLSIYSYEN